MPNDRRNVFFSTSHGDHASYQRFMQTGSARLIPPMVDSSTSWLQSQSHNSFSTSILSSFPSPSLSSSGLSEVSYQHFMKTGSARLMVPDIDNSWSPLQSPPLRRETLFSFCSPLGDTSFKLKDLTPSFYSSQRALLSTNPDRTSFLDSIGLKTFPKPNYGKSSFFEEAKTAYDRMNGYGTLDSVADAIGGKAKDIETSEMPLFRDYVPGIWDKLPTTLIHIDQLRSPHSTGQYLYVITEDDMLRVCNAEDDAGFPSKHAPLAQKKPVRAAGEIHCIEGVCTFNNQSGGFQPQGEHLSSYVLTIAARYGIPNAKFEYLPDTEKLDRKNPPENVIFKDADIHTSLSP